MRGSTVLAICEIVFLIAAIHNSKKPLLPYLSPLAGFIRPAGESFVSRRDVRKGHRSPEAV